MTKNLQRKEDELESDLVVAPTKEQESFRVCKLEWENPQCEQRRREKKRKEKRSKENKREEKRTKEKKREEKRREKTVSFCSTSCLDDRGLCRRSGFQRRREKSVD
jgi:hypothetical protein